MSCVTGLAHECRFPGLACYGHMCRQASAEAFVWVALRTRYVYVKKGNKANEAEDDIRTPLEKREREQKRTLSVRYQ